jgi:hypothetical protein
MVVWWVGSLQWLLEFSLEGSLELVRGLLGAMSGIEDGCFVGEGLGFFGSAGDLYSFAVVRESTFTGYVCVGWPQLPVDIP